MTISTSRPSSKVSNARAGSRSRKGFTLIELMIVMSVLLIVAAVGFPSFIRLTKRAKLTGFVREASVQMARARQEAIRRGVPVVVQPIYDPGPGVQHRLFTFANVDLDPAFVYTPNPAAPPGTVDYQISDLFPSNDGSVNFHGPNDAAPHGPDVVDGGTTLPAAPNGIVFQPDGSVSDTGAFRIADARGNFMELRIAPAATGRVTVLKYNRAPAFPGPVGFYEAGHDEASGELLWEWY